MASDEVARLLAEQTAVDCCLTDVEDVLDGPANRRVLAVLRLAGDTGEAAGRLIAGDRSPLAAARGHELVASTVERRADQVRQAFEWRTQGYVALFSLLAGHLEARIATGGVVLSVEGRYVARPTEAARRAAEVAVRAWLAQLRAALEVPSRLREEPEWAADVGRAPA